MTARETASILTDIAESDLESAMLLHEQRHYRTSYFLFQQASEKANKAMALQFDFIDEKQLFNMKHDQMKIYRKIVTLHYGKLKVVTANHEQLLDNFLRHIDRLYNRNLFDITTSELNDFYEVVEELMGILDDLRAGRIAGAKQDVHRYIDWIEPVNPDTAQQVKALLSSHQPPKAVNRLLRDIVRTGAELSLMVVGLYACAVLTTQHGSKSRYPEKGLNPLKLYSGKLPMIRHQTEFMVLLFESLRLLRKYQKIY